MVISLIHEILITMKTSITVQNLKCGGCAKTIISNLEKISALSNINVDVEKATILFSHQNTSDVLLVKNTLKFLGYPSINQENSILTKGKSFISCATGKF